MKLWMNHTTINTHSHKSIPEPVIETNPTSSLFALYLEPFRNTYQNTYQTIITLDTFPNGPIQSRITRMNPPSLSPFQTVSNTMNSPDSCIYVVNHDTNHNHKKYNQYMTKEDIPDLFSYLIRNGYVIDTSLTKMMNQSAISYGGPSSTRLSGNRSLICMVRYEEPV
jgi:hypothetical protein